MAELKTKVNQTSVTEFLDSIVDEVKRKDSYLLLEMFRKVTNTKPKMWGSSIVGFGNYHYVYESGREGDWMVVGFSPRKQALTLYILGSWGENPDLLARLGKHSLGKGCLYVKRLSDVNLTVLQELIDEAVKRGKIRAQTYAEKKAK